MRINVFISTLIFSILSATSYTTITIDGTSGDWESDEDFSTSTSGWTNYLTWDESYLYFAVSGSSIDDDDKVAFIYIDTDPNASPIGGTGSTSSISWARDHTLPFTANYAFAYKTQSGSDYYNLRTYSSGWQADQTYNGSVSLGTDFLEVSIKWSDIGSPTQINVIIFVQNNDGSWTWSSAPENTISDGAGDKTFSKWLGYNIASGVAPDAAQDANSVIISGNSGFRMMSSPVAGQIYSDLLAELWTQGMTGADVTDGTANVWTLNVSGQSWTALSDISGSGSGASQTAGTGFLVYVFDDTNWDGAADLPVSLSVSGTENSSSASLGSIADGDYGLAGNPFATTIDWDDVTKTSLSGTVNVWDDATSGWKSWNGSSGSLTNGLIAPYQGFWVEASGGTGSVTIETADKASSSGTFYRTLDNDSTGSVSFGVVSADYADQTFMSFMNIGEAGLDNADGKKLLPFSASSRVIGLSYTEEIALDIHNLPYVYEGSLSIPFDVMRLSLDETNYVTVAEEVTLTWDLEELPDHISMTLTDNITGSETYLDYESEYVFTTEPKGSFSANYDGPIGTYPVVGEPRFTLSVTYGALGQNDDATLPSDFALHPIYPNPFNPSATISFDIPDVSSVALNVYDVKGALVETLLHDHMKPGNHHYNWEPQGLSSGVYFMKLTTAKQTFTQKVTYIK
jgi:hypothetical protein